MLGWMAVMLRQPERGQLGRRRLVCQVSPQGRTPRLLVEPTSPTVSEGASAAVVLSRGPRSEVPVREPWGDWSLTGGCTPGVAELCSSETELVPAVVGDQGLSWMQAWLYLLKFSVEQGDSLVGELVSCAEQDAILCIESDEQMVDAVKVSAEQVRGELMFPSLFASLGRVLHQLRGCAAALPGVRQGLLVAAHVSSGAMLDPYSYAPATVQSCPAGRTGESFPWLCGRLQSPRFASRGCSSSTAA